MCSRALVRTRPSLSSSRRVPAGEGGAVVCTGAPGPGCSIGVSAPVHRAPASCVVPSLLEQGAVGSHQPAPHRPWARLGLFSSPSGGRHPRPAAVMRRVHPLRLPLGDTAERGDDCPEGGERPAQSDIWGQGTKGAASEGHQGPRWGHRQVSGHDLFNFNCRY